MEDPLLIIGHNNGRLSMTLWNPLEPKAAQNTVPPFYTTYDGPIYATRSGHDYKHSVNLSRGFQEISSTDNVGGVYCQSLVFGSKDDISKDPTCVATDGKKFIAGFN